MILRGREHLIEYEYFYAMLHICHQVFSFLHPAFRLRAQGAAGGCVTKALHCTTNLVFRQLQALQCSQGWTCWRWGSGRDSHLRDSHLRDHITGSCCSVLCTAQGNNNPCSWAWGMLPLCFLMCALSLAQQAGHRFDFLRIGKIVFSSGTI